MMGAQVLSNSWEVEESQALADAIEGVNRGIYFVAAAGNGGQDLGKKRCIQLHMRLKIL